MPKRTTSSSHLNAREVVAPWRWETRRNRRKEPPPAHRWLLTWHSLILAGRPVNVAVDVGPGGGGQQRVCGGCASSGKLMQYPSWRSSVELTRNG